jgi:hypothetical protein
MDAGNFGHQKFTQAGLDLFHGEGRVMRSSFCAGTYEAKHSEHRHHRPR